MVARMVIGIATQDVERDAREEFFQCVFWVGKTVTDNLGQSFVAGVTRHHFIESEYCQCRHQCLSRPISPFVRRSNRLSISTSLLAAFVKLTGEKESVCPCRYTCRNTCRNTCRHEGWRNWLQDAAAASAIRHLLLSSERNLMS